MDIWTYVISDVESTEIVGTHYQNEFQKTNPKQCRVEKVIKKKAVNYMFNRKTIIDFLIVGLINKILLYENELFSPLQLY